MGIQDTLIQVESKKRYLTYALSVVSGRALPDVRDGLKPVQRRILFAMQNNLHLSPTTGYRKSATVVGEVLGRFHPHSDVACYDAMVRMAQSFAVNHTMVDGEGNFGSVDGDNAAAYRYTEARLTEYAMEVIGEISEETVPFRDNFDATIKEPVVLPVRIPNLLINGATGIAVGMATNIPPHNLRDVIKATIALIENPKTTDSEIVGIIKGPDFPTGCAILNSKKEIEQIYTTGRGTLCLRGDWKLEDGERGKKHIILYTLPYNVIKAQLVEKIGNLIADKKIPQLLDVRDESTTDMRVVLELATDAEAELALAYLFKHTDLETQFAVNLTALVPVQGTTNTRPEQLTLRGMLQHFIDFRRVVIVNKLKFERAHLAARIHLLEGLMIIIDHLDEVIRIVRKSDGRADSAEKLMKRFKLSSEQAYFIVDMRIHQLSKVAVAEVEAELTAKKKRVGDIDQVLKNPKAIDKLMVIELNKMTDKYGRNRSSRIEAAADRELEFNADAYVVHEDVFAIVTNDGWIKRIRQNNELSSTRIREGDAIKHAFPLSTKDFIFCISNLGNIYTLRVADLPSSSGYGEPIQKSLKFGDGEALINVFPSIGDAMIKDGDKLYLVASNGQGCVISAEGVTQTRKSGKRVFKLTDNAKLIFAGMESDYFAHFTEGALNLIVEAKEFPERSGASQGVCIMDVAGDDRIVSVVGVQKSDTLIITADSGSQKEIAAKELNFGKRALKGRKAITRGKISKVEVVRSKS